MPSYPGKIAWVEKMWTRAQEYRAGGGPDNPYEGLFRYYGTDDLPWWLLSGMSYETSRFNAGVRGAAGEWGLLQIMPANAPTCDLPSAESLADPANNIRCGAVLLRKQYDRSEAAGVGPAWEDRAKIAMFANNMGWGNTAPLVTALSAPRSWAQFVSAYGGADTTGILLCGALALGMVAAWIL